MAHEEAPPGVAARPKRMRRVAGVGAQAQQAALLQDLGDALDAAVTATRRSDRLVEGMCRRILKDWRALPQPRIDWLPTELKAGGRVVLVAGGDVGRFVVPAYQAGVRAISLRREATVEHVQALCTHLAALEAGTLHPHALGRLCWRAELLGFDVLLVESVVELGESLVREVAQADLWVDRSARLVDVWSALTSRAAAVPDHAREALYGSRLQQFVARTVAGELELSDDAVVALIEDADDAAGWAAAEVSLLVSHPVVRATLGVDQLGWVLSTYVEHSHRIDDALLDLLATLGADARGEPKPGTPAPFPTEVLGPAFARNLLSGAEPSAETWAALDSLSSGLRLAILTGLYQHGEERTNGPALLSALARRFGMTALIAALDPQQIGPVMAGALVDVALRLGCDKPALLGAIAHMEPKSALSALAVGQGLCPLANGVVTQLLLDAPAMTAELPAFIRSGREAAGCGAAALLGALSRRADLPDLDESMAALVAAGHGHTVVLAVWQSRALRPTARRSALMALQSEPRLFSDAMQWSDSGEEVPEIRQLVEELRWQEPR